MYTRSNRVLTTKNKKNENKNYFSISWYRKKLL
jgi:hypothetical protein